jgi:branched-chain amino acid aminotransferase
METQVNLASQLKPLPPTENLAFGQHFSDHWFTAKYAEGRGWFDSTIEPYGKISLDPAASVLHYGQALFEGMKAFLQPDGSIALFRPDFNYRRLCAGAERLCLEAPPRALFMSALRDLIALEARWVPREKMCSLYIRPTLIGTEPFLGVRPARQMLFYILLSPVGSYYGGGLTPTRIWVEDSALRAAPGGLGAVKAGANYAASLQAAHRAKQKGYDQVLWLDITHDGIEEVGTMNVFFVFNNEIVTPALNGSILPGCTRDSVLQLFRREGKPVIERRLTMAELIQRHARGELLEAFGTGTAAVISPIGELCYKDQSFVINDNAMGPVAEKMLNMITEIQYGYRPDPLEWVVPVAKL